MNIQFYFQQLVDADRFLVEDAKPFRESFSPAGSWNRLSGCGV